MIKLDDISRLAIKHPDKPALTDGATTLTWHEFEQQTNALLALASSLTSNAGPVFFVSENSINIVLLSAAFATIGVPFQGLDPRLGKNAMRDLITKLGVNHLFCSNAFYPACLELNDICNIHSIDSMVDYLKISPVIRDRSTTVTASPTFKSYAFTSGTTGNPKIVYRTSSFEKRRFAFLQQRFSFNEADVHMACLPMYHASSTGWLKLFLSLGCLVVVHHYRSPYQLCELLHAQKVSTTIISPIILRNIIQNLERGLSKNHFPDLRFIITGGKNCPAIIKKEAIDILGPIIHEYYGTTETGINTLLDSDEALMYPGSVGKTFEGNTITILGPQNQPLGPDLLGKIAISSYMTMDCYLNNEAEFVVINNERFLITSDFGYLNDKGYLYVARRSNFQSQKVYNFHAFENEILNLHYIADVFVSEEHSPEDIRLTIVPKKYHPYRYIKDEIRILSGKFGIPTPSIQIVEQLNYTQTGKIKFVEAQ